MTEGTDLRTTSYPVHRPVTLVKPMDRASPPIWQALFRNEQVDAEILFFGVHPYSGETQHIYTVHLEQARVTGVVSEMLHNGYAENENLPVYERVSLAYYSIRWTSEVGSTEYTATRSASR